MTTAGPRTILVTGNLGYIGPVVVERLRASRPEATLIRLDAGFVTGCRAVPERSLDHQYYGDVRTVPGSLLEGVDAVVHLAAISNDPIGNAYDEVTLSVNHEATVRLARDAKRAGARRFVFASSCSIYGVSEDAVATEESPARPLTPYARSKWFAEQGIEQVADDTFAVMSLRFPTACGMSDRLRLDLVLNDFVASAIASQKDHDPQRRDALASPDPCFGHVPRDRLGNLARRRRRRRVPGRQRGLGRVELLAPRSRRGRGRRDSRSRRLACCDVRVGQALLPGGLRSLPSSRSRASAGGRPAGSGRGSEGRPRENGLRRPGISVVAPHEALRAPGSARARARQRAARMDLTCRRVRKYPLRRGERR